MIDRLSAALLAQLSRCLAPGEREGVLGDLSEENRSALRSAIAILNLIAWRTWKTRSSPWRLAVNGTSTLEQGQEKSWAEWAVPLLVGLAIAVATVRVLLSGNLRIPNVPSLLVRSATLLLVAAVAAIVGAFVVHRIYREYFQRPSKWLVACAWTTAIWVPLMLLAWPQRSMWFVLTPIPMAAALAMSSKRQYVALQNDEPSQCHAQGQISFELGEELLSSLPQRFAIVLATLVQFTLLAAIEGCISVTASLVILTTACFTWALTPGTITFRAVIMRRSRLAVLPCFLLTCLALVPFLPPGLALALGRPSSALKPLLRIPHVVSVTSRVHTTVVLLAPTQPRRKRLVVPQRQSFGSAMRPTHPLHIPFDGSYWFSLIDQVGSGNDISVQHGSPETAHVHSTDWTPLRMEARQKLSSRIDASCCSRLLVEVRNADYRSGLIQIEATLRNAHENAVRELALGTVPLRSSGVARISTDRRAVDETLVFSLSNRASSFEFNEIDLRFKLARERNLAGARVRILGFTLVP